MSSCLLFDSDKGLCGGVNSAVAKLSKTSIQKEESEGRRVAVFGVGEKIRLALQRVFADRYRNEVVQSHATIHARNP